MESQKGKEVSAENEDKGRRNEVLENRAAVSGGPEITATRTRAVTSKRLWM